MKPQALSKIKIFGVDIIMTKLTEKDYNDILFEIRRFINNMEDKSLSVTRDLKSVTIGELEKKANGIFNDIQTLRAYLWTKKGINIDNINSETAHNNDFIQDCLQKNCQYYNNRLNECNAPQKIKSKYKCSSS